MLKTNNFTDKQITSIKDYIPAFLEYCKKEKNLSSKSIENYDRFLKRFIDYLQSSNNHHLLPHQLSLKHIEGYKSYLSKIINPATKRPLTNITQNLYLIVIRSILYYFAENNIMSLTADKIKLFKQDSFLPRNKNLNLTQIKKLLSTPNVSKPNGLRDRVILEILISTGLKISQIVSLNKEDLKLDSVAKSLNVRIINENQEENYLQNVSFSREATHWLKKYITIRKDQEKALFINYQGRRNASRRLTARSIQKIVKNYTTINNFPSFTPENLRNIYASHLFNNQNTKIDRPSAHRVKTINYHQLISHMRSSTIPYYKRLTSNVNNWYVVENTINQEIKWLRKRISTMPAKYSKNRLSQGCNDCILRKLAILAVSGQIIIREFKAKNKGCLWNNSKLAFQKQSKITQESKHGKEWHRNMMDTVSKYFKTHNCKVILEPTLNYGRADLEVQIDPQKTVYIEVGTVSLFKIWYNLSTIKNIIFLLIPSEEYIIEFKTN